MSESPHLLHQHDVGERDEEGEHPWDQELAQEAASQSSGMKRASSASPSLSYRPSSNPFQSGDPASTSASPSHYNRLTTMSPVPSYQERRTASDGRSYLHSGDKHTFSGDSSFGAPLDRRSISDSYAPRQAQDTYAASTIADNDHLTKNLLEDTDDKYNPAYDAPRNYRMDGPKHRAEVDTLASNVSLDGSNRLVIAIDFGTTYTGIAFATPNSEEVRDLRKDIELVRNWGYGMDNDQKIPSVISYSPPTAANEQQFGSNLSPTAIAMVNMKLDLDTQDTKLAELESLIHALEGMKNLSYANVKRSDGNPGFSWKSAEEIVTDYLRKVFEAFSRYLARRFKNFSGALKENVPMDLVITVPVQWSYKARNATYRAVLNAGFNDQNFLRMEKVIMLREPEAAALYAVRWLKDDNVEFLRVGDCFVLCDAGGGTVDVVAYKVLKLEPKLELKQISAPTCLKCGSIYIDAKFKEWLRGHLGRSWRELDAKSLKGRINAQTTEGQRMRDVMGHFDGFKKAFGMDQREIKFRLPKPLDDLSVRNVIRGGEVNISQEQMKLFFKDSIDGTISLILSQIAQAETGGRRVKNIVMVGGFAESKYLQDEINNSLMYRNIKLRRPDTSWTAVVQGAVITGVEHMADLTPLKPCPRNYGICLDEDFSSLINGSDDSVYDEPATFNASAGQLHWLIQKGDLLDPKEARVQTKICPFTFRAEQSRRFQFKIFGWESEDPDDELPKHYRNAREELSKIMEFEIDMSSIPLQLMERSDNHGRAEFTANTTCRMTYTSNHQLEVQMVYNRKLVGSCKRDMRQDRESYDNDNDVDLYD